MKVTACVLDEGYCWFPLVPHSNHLCLRRRPTFRIREAAQKVEGHIAELRVSVRGWSNHGNGPGNRTRKEASVRSIGTCFLSVNTKRKSA